MENKKKDYELLVTSKYQKRLKKNNEFGGYHLKFGCFMDGHFSYYARLKGGSILEYNFFLENGSSLCQSEDIDDLFSLTDFSLWSELVEKKEEEDDSYLDFVTENMINE